ncbi:MAG: hypothetical protein R2716_01245 [Microthrixaceae bacterium]
MTSRKPRGRPGATAPGGLSAADIEVLDQSVAPGHGQLVAAAGEDPEVCGALEGRSVHPELDSASGEELVGLLGSAQSPWTEPRGCSPRRASS